ncbi:MAG: BtpA/SgcQ family protein [Cyanobacteria bacterium SZAS LIN-3]|nr:BtpA/SgcQ family protein [Cyanobacteria bacterium SZAS LIN-3]
MFSSISSKSGEKSCLLIGAVHVPALPGADAYGFDMEQVIKQTLADARLYAEAGFDALIVENMHDVPYLRGYVAPETVAAMSVVAQAVKGAVKIPIGVQLLAAANIESLAVAVAADLDFIRVEGFVFAHIGDEGLHQASAPDLVRRRAALKATKVKIFADIKKKHSSHAITADVDLAETAHTAEFFKADGVIVSGLRTAAAPLESEVEEVAAAVKIPTLVGSGVTPENIAAFSRHARGLIIGSYAKLDGHWANACDPRRLEALVKAL